MSKSKATDHGENGVYLRYFCPGCKHSHSVPASRWNWNGSEDNPTLSPSVRHFIPRFVDEDGTVIQEKTTCHYFIRNGNIEFCSDCEHELSGKSVELPDVLKMENK